MSNHTSLAAIAYDSPNGQSKRIIHFYHSLDNAIRESSPDVDNEWNIPPADIVATNAKENTPIAATAQTTGAEVSVFFLDTSHNICHRIRTTNATGEKSGWEDAKRPLLPSIKASPTSQLAAVYDNENDSTIHLFYQAEDDAIRSLNSTGVNGDWVHSSLEITDALPGTALSAVTGLSTLILFFQGKDYKFKEYSEEYSSKSGFGWTNLKMNVLNPQSKVPISAVAWNYQQPNFQKRLYSAVSGNKLFGAAFEKTKGWRMGAQVGKGIVTHSTNGASGIAAVRTSSDGTVYVFYLAKPGFIAVYDVNAGARVPLWIPINQEPNSDPDGTPKKDATTELELKEAQKDRDRWKELYEQEQQQSKVDVDTLTREVTEWKDLYDETKKEVQDLTTKLSDAQGGDTDAKLRGFTTRLTSATSTAEQAIAALIASL